MPLNIKRNNFAAKDAKKRKCKKLNNAFLCEFRALCGKSFLNLVINKKVS